MTKLPFVLVPAFMMIAACNSTPESQRITCNADAAQRHVGHMADAAMIEAARKDAGAETVRTIKPGQVVTMEYMFNRLNVYVDANGRIERIACG